MDKTAVAKRVTSAIVGFVTAKVVKEIIKNNTTPESAVDKTAVMVGSYVLGAIAADASKEWTDARIEELIEWWVKNVMDKLPKK